MEDESIIQAENIRALLLKKTQISIDSLDTWPLKKFYGDLG